MQFNARYVRMETFCQVRNGHKFRSYSSSPDHADVYRFKTYFSFIFKSPTLNLYLEFKDACPIKYAECNKRLRTFFYKVNKEGKYRSMIAVSVCGE